MTGSPSFRVLAVTHVAMLGAGYILAPKLPIDTEVKHDGFFQVTTSKVLATTIESLREENQLLIYSYKGTARVQTERTKWLIFDGRQELLVPAVVNYYVNLAELSLANVEYTEKSKIVTIHLPKVTMGDIAFQPESAMTINGGSLTFSETQTEELRKANYAKARQAMIAQAQQPGLLHAAQNQAVSNVTNLFEIPLRVAGQPDVKVVATFD
jgi:hypothetical protein